MMRNFLIEYIAASVRAMSPEKGMMLNSGGSDGLIIRVSGLKGDSDHPAVNRYFS
jgi:hypothetical protein